MSESNKFEILVVQILAKDSNNGYKSGQYKVCTIFNVDKPICASTDNIDWVALYVVNGRISTETPVIGGIYTIVSIGKLDQLELSYYRHCLVIDEWSSKTVLNGKEFTLCHCENPNIRLSEQSETLLFFHDLTNADKCTIDNSCKFEFTMWSPSIANISDEFKLPNFYTAQLLH
jgi:hypothetical protein